MIALYSESLSRKISLMQNRSLPWIVLFALALAIGVRVYSALRVENETLWREQAGYQTVRELIREKYVGEPDPKKMFYGAVDGMLSSLDSHSQFLEPQDYEDLENDLDGHFVGIGIEISSDKDGLYIVTPIADTPAWKGGILPGDRIVAIDGIAASKLTEDEAHRKFVGAAGTAIRVVVLHTGTTTPVELTIVRGTIEVKSTSIVEILDQDWVPAKGPRIGYVEITQFQQNTGGEMDAALKKLEAQGMQALVLDLRNNPGGALEAAGDVADLFLDEGLIVSVITRANTKHKSERRRTAKPDDTHPKIPMVVMVNERSASASEIVSGALQDHGRAILLGNQTYGKFSVQEIIPVSLEDWGNAGLKLTIAKYKTAKGECIDGTGIKPEVLIPMTDKEELARLQARRERQLKQNDPRNAKKFSRLAPPKFDKQLLKAVEVLLEKLNAGKAN